MDGILNVYKEKGFTSHDVVAKLRGILRMKKIGHTGTLDPDAVGVLPVCLGKGTKVCDLLTEKQKTYETILQLGVTTDTQDLSGKVLSEIEVTASKKEIEKAISMFCGKYMQIPPMYSALKVNGKKLYELAREGKEIERQPREVYIYNLVIHKIDMDLKQVYLKVDCSKGTYIRTLCHDIGEKLGCGGAMLELKRTRVSDFLLQDSYTLSEIELLMNQGRLAEVVIPIDKLFEQQKRVVVSSEYQKYVDNGNKISRNFLEEPVSLEIGEQVRVYDSNKRFIGIYQSEKLQELKPVKIFI
ncbi:tRNA pseudouridine(55) synthase TruB [Anaeromicropila populeti]|uniref:tRNA pseudouridine synthase B n=1 Tax=Anaeromicropila populeti TaxID=37658 RepID=A0A1I6JS49_9FIRM|nr:tRNA pseudouridine(55) synthase TruB [Anaeromicropila populeti]SFR81751.1 tRNA pseudouridine synthase B [Anaeromicropila populeti]